MRQFAVAVILLVVGFGPRPWALWATSRSVPAVTARQAARYAALNAHHPTVWVVPNGETKGLGKYADKSNRLEITVLNGEFGPMTLDDACGAAEATGSPLQYWASFRVQYTNYGRTRIAIQQSNFTLAVQDGANYEARWDVPTFLQLQPGETAKRSLSFYGLPPRASIYSLQYASASGTTNVVGTYRVYPDGRKPPC